MPLTAKQERFCNEYLIDLNAKQAAIRSGYSPKTAEVQASRLLSNVKVSGYIQERQIKLKNKVGITQEMVLEGYRKLAFYDARRFYDDAGNLVHVPDLDDETAFALTGFEVMEEKGGDGDGHQIVLGYTKKIKMSDRKGALDSICKVLGFNAAEKRELTGKNGKELISAPVMFLSADKLTDEQLEKYLKKDAGPDNEDI